MDEIVAEMERRGPGVDASVLFPGILVRLALMMPRVVGTAIRCVALQT